ncbi:hypothetical protein H7Y21_03370 [Arenimonas sp.]|nr:hypothetical protein [Candidatus Parcubacteria bacterium]
MESNPKFIKDFSKEQSQEERDQLATEIKNTRAKYFQSKEQESNLELEEIEKTKTSLEKISDFLPTRIKDFLKFVKIRSTLPQVESQIEKDVQSDDLPEPMIEAKTAIDKFYTKQKKKWSESPYSKEDITEYFSPEHLSSLTLEEYILLLQRFPSQMVTHVTRQGVRDHVGAVNHFAGVDKLWNGFKEIVEDGALKSSFAIHVTDNAKEDVFINFLNLKNKTKPEAMRDINYIIGEESQHHHGSFADIRSVHFATEEVADAHYGSETGNEIFFAYPSAMIASQYVFSGQLSNANGGYHNNQWVFADEKGGLSIDSSIVFIPKNVPVDRNTGSKYELNESLEPIKNEELFNQLFDLISQDDFKEFAVKYEQVLGNSHLDINTFLNGTYTKTNYTKAFEDKMNEAIETLVSKFAITDKNLYQVVLTYEFLRNIVIGEAKENRIYDSLKKIGLSFSLAKDTVSSEEYWENYFNKNPNIKKPSKIVYYEQTDPTLALKTWKSEKGLYKKDKNQNIGFVENYVDLSNTEEVKSKIPFVSRFKSLANDIAERFYDDN